MQALKSFFKTTLMGGILVVLPVGLCLFLTVTIYQYLTALIAPLTGIFFPETGSAAPGAPPAEVWLLRIQVLTNNAIVIALLLGGCFFIGLLVRTSLGSWLYAKVESRLLKRVPMYSLIKEILVQFLGTKKSPFSSVARVQLFDQEVFVTAFVTDSQPDGTCTVFVPTGPNPTSGNIYHLPADRVSPLPVSVEEAMRSIISCGAGSAKLLAEKPADS